MESQEYKTSRREVRGLILDSLCFGQILSLLCVSLIKFIYLHSSAVDNAHALDRMDGE